ncbi:MAG: hypothetical protein WDW38_007589 [Sanguina aurantia]
MKVGERSYSVEGALLDVAVASAVRMVQSMVADAPRGSVIVQLHITASGFDVLGSGPSSLFARHPQGKSPAKPAAVGGQAIPEPVAHLDVQGARSSVRQQQQWQHDCPSFSVLLRPAASPHSHPSQHPGDEAQSSPRQTSPVQDRGIPVWLRHLQRTMMGEDAPRTPVKKRPSLAPSPALSPVRSVQRRRKRGPAESETEDTVPTDEEETGGYDESGDGCESDDGDEYDDECEDGVLSGGESDAAADGPPVLLQASAMFRALAAPLQSQALHATQGDAAVGHTSDVASAVRDQLREAVEDAGLSLLDLAPSTAPQT